jgi:hypothetical protein
MKEEAEAAVETVGQACLISLLVRVSKYPY